MSYQLSNMLKAVSFIFCFVFLFYEVNSQNRSSDSIKVLLTAAESDTAKIILMTELASVYRLSNLDSALIYGQRALRLASQKNFLRGEAAGHFAMGYALREQGDLALAMDHVLKGLDIAKTNGHFREAIFGNIVFATIHYDLKKWQTAIDYFQEGLQISQEINDPYAMDQLYLLIGANYVVHNTIINHLDSAEKYLNLAHQYSEILGNQSLNSTIYRNLGRLHQFSGRLDSAMYFYKLGIGVAIQNDDFRNASYNQTLTASLFMKLGQPDSSIFYGIRALEIADGKFQKRVLESSTILAEAFKAKYQFEKAYEYKEIAEKARENIYSAGNIQNLQNLMAKEEERQRELEIAQAAFENKIKTEALSGGFIALLVVAFLLYRNNRIQKKSKRTIEIAYKRLQNTQTQLIHSEKMASLGELTAGIAHEIQNPLNFVNNFSEINNDLLDDLKTAIAENDQEEIEAIYKDLKENESKVAHHGKRAETIVKSMLQHSRTGSGEKELTDINALADEYLRLAYHGLRAKDQSFNADFKTEFDPDLPKIEVVPQDIGRVFLNLINNAFQAVAEVDNPQVKLETKKLQNSITISVADNGPGIPDDIKDKIFQPFFTTKPTGEGTGLGLSMSYDIVTKGHGGELKVESKKGDGSIFTIQLH